MVLVRGTEAVGSETSYTGPRGSPVSQHSNGEEVGQDWACIEVTTALRFGLWEEELTSVLLACQV